VLVRVDEAGRDHTSARVEHARRRMELAQRGCRSDRDDAIAGNRDRAADQDPSLRIHREDVAVDDEQVRRARFDNHGHPRRGGRPNTSRTMGSK
jgi:hypothetical protein